MLHKLNYDFIMEPMSINLSIKSVPEYISEGLKMRAKRNHRSVQGEVMAILEQAMMEEPLSITDLKQELQRMNFQTESDVVSFLREDRER